MKPPSVFLSYVKADQSWAEKLSALLPSVGVRVCNLRPDPNVPEPALDELRQALLNSTHTFVLIGPTTRFSKWVNREIELSTEARDDGPGAALIGVILPTHDDFSRPYYDPENVPVRLHDLIQNEYALLRKWSEDPSQIARWLEDAARRRASSRPEPSLGAAAQIYRFAWDASVDEARPSSEAL